MERLVQRLLTIFRLVLSQLGFSVGVTPPRDRYPTHSNQVEAPSSVPTVDHGVVYELLRPQQSDSLDRIAVLETEAPCTDEVIHSHMPTSVTVGERKSTSAGLTAEGESEVQSLSLREALEHEPVIEQDLTVLTIASGDNENPAEAAGDVELVSSPSPDSDPPPLVLARALVSPNNDDSDRNTSLHGVSPGSLIDSHDAEPTISQQPIGASVQQQNTATACALVQDADQTSSSSRSADDTLDGDSSASPQCVALASQYGDEGVAASTIAAEPSAKDDRAQAESPREDSSEVLQYVPDSRLERTEADSRSGRAAKPPSPRRPAPAEDAGEYRIAVHDISTVDREYASWNSAIVEQLLLAKPLSEQAYLCVTPRILASAFAEAGFDTLTPEEAEHRFITAVSNVYRERVLNHSERLRVLRRCGRDGLPDCVAFLAVSVLAAYRMQSDEETSANAYYIRLSDLLGCEMSGSHPAGFSPTVFESLWVFISNWLDENHGQRLVMPGTEIGLRRFVALPLAHVPLRCLDIEKLPTFFGWAGYEPQSRVQRDELFADLRLWQETRNALTQTGAQALFDDRSDAVIAQVSAELESWDGSFSESVTRRSALVEIQFDIIQRQPMLAYLPRRPSGFPAVFSDGERVLEASDEGWYDPFPIGPPDGEPLASGFEWQSVVEGMQFTLRRPSTGVLALAPSSNYSGFLSSRHLLRGVKCAVLCRNELVDKAVDYLSEVARQSLNAVNHPLLPSGWSIIRDVTARQRIEAPAGLEPIEIDPNIDLLVSGGLRAGPRWSWLAGAPPRVFVTGIEESEKTKVNGVPYEVSANGELMCKGLIAQPGEYLIEVGRVRRRIQVVEPVVWLHSSSDGLDIISANRTVTVALPQGSWTLIGASPGEVCTAQSAFLRGTLASCSFEPIWAVQVGAGLGARVVVLANPEPPCKFDTRRLMLPARKAWGRWASMIYNANIRRPRFIGLNGIHSDERSALVWKQYALAAKQIKRALKRL